MAAVQVQLVAIASTKQSGAIELSVTRDGGMNRHSGQLHDQRPHSGVQRGDQLQGERAHSGVRCNERLVEEGGHA